MKYKIEKGDKFLCIKKFVMEDGDIDYKKGGHYTSEKDHCITDEAKDKNHEMDCLETVKFFEHFKLI